MAILAITTPCRWLANATCTSFPSCGVMRPCTSPTPAPMLGGAPIASMAAKWITTTSQCIVDDDTINEQFHQLSALSKCQVVERWLHTLAKRLNTLGQGRHIDMLLCLGIELPQLPSSLPSRPSRGRRPRAPLMALPYPI